MYVSGMRKTHSHPASWSPCTDFALLQQYGCFLYTTVSKFLQVLRGETFETLYRRAWSIKYIYLLIGSNKFMCMKCQLSHLCENIRNNQFSHLRGFSRRQFCVLSGKLIICCRKLKACFRILNQPLMDSFFVGDL